MAVLEPNINWFRKMADKGPVRIEIGNQTFVVEVRGEKSD